MQEALRLGGRDLHVPLLQVPHHGGGQAVPGDHDVGLADRDVFWRRPRPVRRLRKQVPNRCVREARLDAGDHHFTVRLVGIERTDVVPEFRGLGDAVLHVRAALGVVHRPRLFGDDGAHHAAGEAVQHTQIGPALLVELDRCGQLALIRPRRHLPRVLDEVPQVIRQAGRQRLAVLGPVLQQLVHARHLAAVDQRRNHRIGLVVPHAPGVGPATGSRYRTCRRPCPRGRRNDDRRSAGRTQHPARLQRVAPTEVVHAIHSPSDHEFIR